MNNNLNMIPGPKKTISRRKLLKNLIFATTAFTLNAHCKSNASDNNLISNGLNFPLIDFHVHLEGEMTIERAVKISKERKVKFGILDHAGCGFRIGNDETLRQFIAKLRKYPVYIGIQTERLNWMTCFSKEVVSELDYILSDALRYPDKNGREIELWTSGVKIDDIEYFMDHYVEHNIAVISNMPIDIIASFTFLPACIAERYDELWTKERMERVIETAVKHDVAMEISSRRKIPRATFIKMAKDAGCKFSFGTNKQDGTIGQLDYSIKMAKECAITQNDMFMPKLKTKNQ